MIVLTTGSEGLAQLMRGDRIASPASVQTRSTAMARASPPPIHRLATPLVPPRA